MSYIWQSLSWWHKLVAGLLVIAVAAIGVRVVPWGDWLPQGPESAPRNFVHALAAKNCTQMLDHVCGTFACPALPNIAFEIRDESYTVQPSSERNATVETYVDIRARGKLGEVKVQLTVPLEVEKPGSVSFVQSGVISLDQL
jgi:hypothetical protein